MKRHRYLHHEDSILTLRELVEFCFYLISRRNITEHTALQYAAEIDRAHAESPPKIAETSMGRTAWTAWITFSRKEPSFHKRKARVPSWPEFKEFRVYLLSPEIDVTYSTANIYITSLRWAIRKVLTADERRERKLPDQSELDKRLYALMESDIGYRLAAVRPSHGKYQAFMREQGAYSDDALDATMPPLRIRLVLSDLSRSTVEQVRVKHLMQMQWHHVFEGGGINCFADTAGAVSTTGRLTGACISALRKWSGYDGPLGKMTRAAVNAGSTTPFVFGPGGRTPSRTEIERWMVPPGDMQRAREQVERADRVAWTAVGALASPTQNSLNDAPRDEIIPKIAARIFDCPWD